MINLTRREALLAVAAAAAAPRTMAQSGVSPQEGPLSVGLLAYPDFTALDLVGPQYVLSLMSDARVSIVAKSKEPVPTDTGFAIVPNEDFAGVSGKLDVLVVPGGTSGTVAAIEDDETMEFVRRAAGTCRYVGSVCTGSLLLGAAGLLKGYRATCHWAALELLPEVGATPAPERVVWDRDRVTGGGVTAGIDFGLSLVQRLRGDDEAKAIQLLAQYAPDPLFPAEGDPATASDENRQMLTKMLRPFVADARRALARRSHA